MGLDMYAFRARGQVDGDVDVTLPQGELAELHYWRKHPNLHGWFEALYRAKGGMTEDFNCATVKATESDLDKLEADIKGRKLPSTRGFFFGQSDGTEFDDDIAFIAKAREAISAGDTVLYDSWW